MFRFLRKKEKPAPDKDTLVVDGYSYRAKLIKQGLAGRIYLGQKIATKEPVVVKKIDRPDDDEYYKYLRGEVDILHSVNLIDLGLCYI